MSFNKSLLTMISQDLKKKKKPSRPRAPKQQLMDEPNPFYVANSDIAGQGAFAGQYIPKGSMVDMLHQINQPGVDYDFTALGRKYNHSDRPNTMNKLVGNQRFMVATEDIMPGQELTGNYRMQPDLEQPQETWKMRMGGLLSRSVTCRNCGHAWRSTDGGKDPLTCHKCGHLNLMQKGGELIPVSPLDQMKQAVQPTPTVPYLQTKDPVAFYKSWIQSPEYARRQLATGYVASSEDQSLLVPSAEASRKTRLGALENIAPVTYSGREASKATPGLYGSPSYVNINPSDYVDTDRASILAHELAHIAGATVPEGTTRPGIMSGREQEIFKKSMLPLKEPTLSGVQGSKEREASKRTLEDWQHSQKPQEAKADLDALRFMMYDKGIYDITKGKKFTEADFEKANQNLGKDRVFKRLTNRVGKKNFVNLMNTIAAAQEEAAPIAMHGGSMYLNRMQEGGERKDGTYVAPSNKIAQLQLLESPEYHYRKYVQSLPQLRQAPGRGEELVRQGLGYADVATDVMQMGNFVPLPQAQFVGKIGNVAGSIVDATQAAMDTYNGDYGSALINAGSTALPAFIKSPKILGGYRRSAKYNFGNRSSYLPVDKRYGKMTEKQLLGNRVLFNVLGAETVYDAVPQKQEGGPTRISTSDPRYAELYKNRQVGAYYDGAYSLPDLPEVTVTGKDERMQEGRTQGSNRFVQGLAGVLGSPQTGIMEVITGKQQTPSQAVGFQNPGGWLDNYSSFGKNLSNFAMDAVLDPMNVLGVGIADDIARTSLRTAGRNVSRQAPVSARVTYDLMDESIDPFGEVLKNVKIDNSPSSFAEDVKQAALEYQQLTRDPRYLERVQRIDQDFGTKMEPLLNSFNRSEAEDSGKFFPFNISIKDELPEANYLGASGLSEAGIKKFKNPGLKIWPFNRGRHNVLPIDPATDRYVEIGEKMHRATNTPVRGTVRHELKHHWTNALIDPQNKNYAQALKNLMASRGSVVADARDLAANADYTYLAKPIEIDAFVMTEMRDEMVKRGYLKDHFDELTENKLNEFLSKEDYRTVREYFNPSAEMVRDKGKFVDFFNKYGLPATVTGGVLSQTTDKKKSGGQTRDEREMVNGIADILKQVKDKQNREQIARQMMADFEREDVTYDAKDFKEMAQLKYGGHGGLDRWFAEKWVDVKTGKDCGRQEGESRKGYPACRPSKRITSETPKTSGELSASEKAKFKREKTSSERISYNHKKATGGQTGWLEKYN